VERMFLAHVQALCGETGAALRASDAGIPRSNETIGVMVHLFALSAQILALLQVGRFGDALRIIRESQEIAQKNGSDPWLFLYREAWLRTLAMDFPGARRVCSRLIHDSVYPTGWPRASRRSISAARTRRGARSRRSAIRRKRPNSSCTGTGGCTPASD